MSVFSSDRFLETVKSTYFGAGNAEIAIVSVGGSRYKTLVVDGDKPLAGIPFMDYTSPLATSSEIADPRDLKVIPSPRIRKAVLAEGPLTSADMTADLIASLKEDGSQPFGQGATISPSIKFTEIGDFSAYKKTCSKRNSRAFSPRTPKKLDKLKSEGAAVECCFRVDKDRQQEVFDALLGWKEKQYLRTDVPNLFAVASTRAFLQNLLDNELLVLSAVFVAGKPIAAHAGYIYEGVFYYLLPGYDLEQRKLSAGLVLMEYMITESQREGLSEFDFLLGDEGYKFYYANYYRIVGMAGEPDQLESLLLYSKNCLKRVLYQNETIKGTIKSIMKARRKRGAG